MSRRASAWALAGAVLGAGCANVHFGSPTPAGPEPKPAKAEEMGQVAVAVIRRFS